MEQELSLLMRELKIAARDAAKLADSLDKASDALWVMIKTAIDER